jgi:hypothetical protein
LDAALANGVRSYDWQHKLRIQLTVDELPVILSVLLSHRANCEFLNHGTENNKGFSVSNQKTKFFWRVFAGREAVRAVPMEPEDAFQVAALLMSQLKRQWPEMSASDLAGLVRVMAPMMAHKHIASPDPGRGNPK